MCVRCVMVAATGMELVVSSPGEYAGVQVPWRACFVSNDLSSVTLDLFNWRWGTPDPEEGLFGRLALSMTDAYRALQNPKLLIQISAARYLDLRRQIRRSGLPEVAPAAEIRQAYRDFKRPMLGNSSACGIESVSVYLRGRALTFGKHPLAANILSIVDGLAKLHRHANEGNISWGDRSRMEKELIAGKRFPNLPHGTPQFIEAIAMSV